MADTYTLPRPASEIACAQTILLYQEGYLSLAAAKGLVRDHGGSYAQSIVWSKIKKTGYRHD